MNDELVITIRVEDFQALQGTVHDVYALLLATGLADSTPLLAAKGLISSLSRRLATMPRSPSRQERADWPVRLG
ncbi:MAG: hypothetical protein V4792_00260 [Pseudomonadota bacterium]